jgi:hypothetical protein
MKGESRYGAPYRARGRNDVTARRPREPVLRGSLPNCSLVLQEERRTFCGPYTPLEVPGLLRKLLYYDWSKLLLSRSFCCT